MAKKILIVVGGNKSKIELFGEAAQKLGVPVTLASLSGISYSSLEPGKLLIDGMDPASFDVIYIRMVGKRLEDVTLLVNYLDGKNVRIVDSVYHTEKLMPSTISKAHETLKLVNAGIPMPKTLYGALKTVASKGQDAFGFPFIIKSTSGRKAREVWIADSAEALLHLQEELGEMEKKGMRFFAQEFVEASIRYRILVIGGRAVAGIYRPTKWRKRFNETADELKGVLSPISEEVATLAVNAAKEAGLDIAGIDVLVEDKTGRQMIIEANAAPAWELIRRDLNMAVEEEILTFLNTL